MNNRSSKGAFVYYLGMVGLSVCAILSLITPLVFDASFVSLAYLVLYFICLTSAWNLFSGFSGYINFGFVVFIGIGMYVAVIAIVDFGVWWPVAWLIGGVGAALFAGAISYPILRTRDAYFSIAMLAIAEGTRIMFGTHYLVPVTRGGKGIPVVVADLQSKYYGMLILTVVVLILAWRIAKARFGLELLAVREDETLATGLGINTASAKIIAFILSAFFAGTAGGIHATFLHYIEPFAAFDLKYTVFPVVMAQFGGLGTVLGPVIGALVLEVINDLTWLHLARLNMTIFGLLLIFLLLGLPQGVLPTLKETGLLRRTRSI